MKITVIVGDVRHEFSGRIAKMIMKIIECKNFFQCGTKDVTLKCRGSEVDVWVNAPITE